MQPWRQLRRQDLIEWHDNHVHYRTTLFSAVVGDFDSAKMEARLREGFCVMAQGTRRERSRDQARTREAGILRGRKNRCESKQHSYGWAGHHAQESRLLRDLGVQRSFRWRIFVAPVWATFGTTKGLAYAVGGGVGAGWDHPGMLRLMVSTKSKTTIESIRALDEEIADLGKRPINDEEIKRAKDSILNSFVFRFDSPAKVLAGKNGL